MKKKALAIFCGIVAIAIIGILIWGRNNATTVMSEKYNDGVEQIDINTIYLENSGVEVDFSEVLLGSHEEMRKLIVSTQEATVSTELADKLIQKIDFEMSVLAMNAPERVDKILAKAQSISHKEYLVRRTSEFYKQKLDSGALHARVNEMELLTYISSVYTGIQTSCIVHNCYNRGPFATAYQPRVQFKVLAKTVNYLLGVDE